VSTDSGPAQSQLDAIRARLAESHATSVAAAGSQFLEVLSQTFESLVLARLFMVLPAGSLPADDQVFAARLADGHPAFKAETPCLTLIASRGREPQWNDRALSRGHRAIPLIDSGFVGNAPMLAKLLADLEVDLRQLDDGQPLAVRRMLGGQNGTFYVADAQSACDTKGRSIIADRDFVRTFGVRTVFGMGGAYVDGTLVIAIVFTTELLERLVVDRFPSLISNFKMATSTLLSGRRIFESSAQ
jgi:hypothetical protein